MAVCPILQLGNPDLLQTSSKIEFDGQLDLEQLETDLQDTMRLFRREHGWGRAIAAIQIGQPVRAIYTDWPQARLLVNPKLTNPSGATFEMWDDCMSFPNLMVKVRRYVSFDLVWQDKQGREFSERIEGDYSELLQHELDHLDGVLATHNALDATSFMERSEWIRQRGQASQN